ncbi:alpha/beta hydrolase [Streptomyces sp. XM4193]|uniref:alpha/beta hydrolase n=1 Tax=Streptomyces sp. XM4193 TaxID=2929782 RepID=UPI001FFB3184|nr:alpha/beta hydrolase [Streptomyces sp. XM4193]MCK1796818.1 alpha/beta hydrolase [Streptomyces sp. XM4193]
MATTYVLIHGAGESGSCWRAVAAELKRYGDTAVAPDLPCDDDLAGLGEYADAVVDAVESAGVRGRVVVVAHSFGGFTAPQVAERLEAEELVLVSAMVPAPMEPPGDWWENTGFEDAVRRAAREDGGLTGNEDPFVCFYHDVPRPIAERALAATRQQSGAPVGRPWPLPRWPAVRTRYVLCTGDRFMPAEFARRMVAERLGVVPEELETGHMPMLSRPGELAALLRG